jgi:hypothetical protein
MLTILKTNEHYHLPKEAGEKLMRFLRKFYKENPDYGKNPVCRVDENKKKPVPDWW